MNLDNILNNPKLLSEFILFNEMEHSTENIKFIIYVREFKNIKNKRMKQLKYDQIIEKFINHGSEMEINTTNENKNIILNNLDKLNSDIFDVLYNKVKLYLHSRIHHFMQKHNMNKQINSIK